MINALPKTTLAAAITAAALGFAPGAQAQEAPTLDACVAEASPLQVPAAAPAVQVTFNLSEDIGAIGDIEASESSGLAVAAPEDMPRTEMSADPSEAQPIQMTGQNVWILWLNTENAEAGEHEFQVVGTDGTCTATLTVQPAG